MISEEAQTIATELQYAPLPAEVVELVRSRIDLLGANLSE
jgi:hypothetical protein